MKKLVSFLSLFLLWAAITGAAILLDHAAEASSSILFMKYDLHLVFTILIFPFAVVFSRLFTFGARLIAGRRCGYTLVELSAFGLGWHRSSDKGLRFGFRKPVAYFFHLETPPAYDGTSPYRLYLLCGAIPSAVLGALALLAFALLHHIPEMLYVAFFGLGLITFALLTFLPDERLPFTLVRRLDRSLPLRRAWEHSLFVQANQRQRTYLTAMPEDFFHTYPEELWHDPLIFSAQHNTCSRLLSDGRYQQAHDGFTRLYAFLSQPSVKVRQKEIELLFLTCSCALAEMLAGAEPDFSNRINEPNIELFLSRGGWASQLLLAQYIREILITGDAAAAQRLYSAIERLPEPLSQGQRRILSDAQALAETRTKVSNDLMRRRDGE